MGLTATMKLQHKRQTAVLPMRTEPLTAATRVAARIAAAMRSSCNMNNNNNTKTNVINHLCHPAAATSTS